MTIKTLAAKGLPERAIALQLEVCEGTVRYHLRRLQAAASDGRARQAKKAAAFSPAIEHWMGQQRESINVAALHEWLVAEHDYSGSLRGRVDQAGKR